MGKFKTLFGKYIYILAAVTVVGGGGLFAYFKEAGLEPWCEDKVCQVGVECNISCSVHNPDYKSKYLYNYGDWKVTFRPDIVKSDIYAKYYGKWRFTNFTKATRFPNIKDKAKFVFVFPARTTKYFQVRVNVSEPKFIKWDFGLLDPKIVSWNYLFENLSTKIKLYEDVFVEVKSVYYPENNTWSIPYNYTKRKYVGSKIRYYGGKRIGMDIGGKKKFGIFNVENDILSEWGVPIGDRNFDEYGTCEPYVVEKGFCKLTNLSEVLE